MPWYTWTTEVGFLSSVFFYLQLHTCINNHLKGQILADQVARQILDLLDLFSIALINYKNNIFSTALKTDKNNIFSIALITDKKWSSKKSENFCFLSLSLKQEKFSLPCFNKIFLFRCNNSKSLPSWGQFLRASFTLVDPKSAKKTVKLSSFLRFWDLWA